MATDRAGRQYYTGSKLTVDDVLAIRARYAAGGITYEELGRLYGVTKCTIGLAVRGVTWGDKDAREKLTDTQVCEIWERVHLRGDTVASLAEAYGVSEITVYGLASGVRRSTATSHLRPSVLEAEEEDPRSARPGGARGEGA